MLRLASAVDPAVGLSQRADFFTIGTVGLDTQSGRIHVLDIFRDRIPAPDQPAVLEQHYRKWRTRGLAYILVEKTYSQTALCQYLARRGLCAFKPIDLRKMGNPDKEVRAASLAARYEQGQIVHPPKAPWLDDYETELLEFPNGEHDDQVDAVTYAVDELTLNPGNRPTEVQYLDFTYDRSEEIPDDSGLYSELGIGAHAA